MPRVALEENQLSKVEWHLAMYGSGTIVVTTYDPNLSHFYIYGPAPKFRTSEHQRKTYAEELRDFLNGKIVKPEWLDIGTMSIRDLSFNWADETSIICIDNVCGRDAAQELFDWFLQKIRSK